MHHLRVELHAVKPAFVIGDRRLGCVGGVGETHEALGQGFHRITVTHPHRGAIVHIGEQIGGIVDFQRCLAVFGPSSGSDNTTTQLLHHQLHAVADPEHRNAQRPDLRIAERSTLGIDRTGSATENDPLRSQFAQLVSRGAVTQNHGEHFGFTHAARNQFGILGAEIKNDDGWLTLTFARNLGHLAREPLNGRPQEPAANPSA